jgi:hypothetical protein
MIPFVLSRALDLRPPLTLHHHRLLRRDVCRSLMDHPLLLYLFIITSLSMPAVSDSGWGKSGPKSKSYGRNGDALRLRL